MIEFDLIDKEAWGDGPWANEPDAISYEQDGFLCVLLRHPALGHWCGYVAVESSHPWYGKHYDSSDGISPTPEVHGGITYSSSESPQDHVQSRYWWLGFDCAHAWDLVPGVEFGLPSRSLNGTATTYRDAWYVIRGVNHLACTAAAATGAESAERR